MTPTMKKILKSWLLAAALCFCVTAAAERPMLIHSHNDYCRRAPFWQAYAQGVYSIEADVFLHDGRLLVGHDVEDLSPDMTFESLYVEPIVTLFGRNGGRAWKDSDERLQLMVELKSATEPTLQAVTALLGRYPEVFDPAVNPEAVRIAVTAGAHRPRKRKLQDLFAVERQRFDHSRRACEAGKDHRPRPRLGQARALLGRS